MCDYCLRRCLHRSMCVAYVATVRKTTKMGLILHAFHHDSWLGLNEYVGIACRIYFAHFYGVCVLPMWQHLIKHPKWA